MNYVSPVKDTKFVLENLLNNPSAIENDLMNSIPLKRQENLLMKLSTS
ncbi:MAG: hypothetical protein CM15mP114_15930 [Alphaproteobacteria bacterium]|nr:MAG: hypothetical protein CM15mP114_15930 [Alphaproteobacteria bacterium]